MAIVTTVAEPDRHQIRERTTRKFTATLVDENAAPIPLANLGSLTLTLYDLETKAIINLRSNQNIINANNVTYHATSGLLTWDMQPTTDNAIVRKSGEVHVALFRWTYDTTKHGHHIVEFEIVNTEYLP